MGCLVDIFGRAAPLSREMEKLIWRERKWSGGLGIMEERGNCSCDILHERRIKIIKRSLGMHHHFGYYLEIKDKR